MKMLVNSSNNLYYVLAEMILMLLQLYDKEKPPFSRLAVYNINLEGILYEPTVVSCPGFSPEYDVYRIRNMTSNEKNDKLLQVLLSRTNAERQSIVHNYQKLFDKVCFTLYTRYKQHL
ncbi:Annexin A3 (Annexin III) [Schistosoma japonicum]|nr:Annexin A3 (Annexin III) [Schistosoma japonicum]